MHTDLIQLAIALAEAARPIARRYFRAEAGVETKPDQTPVTLADKGIEILLRQMLDQARPGDGFFGEETGSKASKSGLTWVIDPIDGTKAFVCGKPLFGTLIACLEGETPILGMIDQPILNERWLGARGAATTFNGQPVRTRACPGLAVARLGTTSPRLFTDLQRERFEALSVSCAITTYGGDCYNYALVASGMLDLVAEAGLKLYDYAALIPVIEGAGGVVTGWDGTAPHDGTILASGSAALHREALAILAN
jgi:histidinol phosphatase-like enzyme (inositol monophosphatase family)